MQDYTCRWTQTHLCSSFQNNRPQQHVILLHISDFFLCNRKFKTQVFEKNGQVKSSIIFYTFFTFYCNLNRPTATGGKMCKIKKEKVKQDL